MARMRLPASLSTARTEEPIGSSCSKPRSEPRFFSRKPESISSRGTWAKQANEKLVEVGVPPDSLQKSMPTSRTCVLTLESPGLCGFAVRSFNLGIAEAAL